MPDRKASLLSFKNDHHIEMAKIDPDRLKQVLLNLYLNAIEAMDGEGAITVALMPSELDNGIQITVSDTGPGIKQEDLPHLFDPYFTTKSSGTGLGLAIVHKIIESHKGEIQIKSRPGEGTHRHNGHPRRPGGTSIHDKKRKDGFGGG